MITISLIKAFYNIKKLGKRMVAYRDHRVLIVYCCKKWSVYYKKRPLLAKIIQPLLGFKDWPTKK